MDIFVEDGLQVAAQAILEHPLPVHVRVIGLVQQPGRLEGVEQGAKTLAYGCRGVGEVLRCGVGELAGERAVGAVRGRGQRDRRDHIGQVRGHGRQVVGAGVLMGEPFPGGQQSAEMGADAAALFRVADRVGRWRQVAVGVQLERQRPVPEPRVTASLLAPVLDEEAAASARCGIERV